MEALNYPCQVADFPEYEQIGRRLLQQYPELTGRAGAAQFVIALTEQYWRKKLGPVQRQEKV